MGGNCVDLSVQSVKPDEREPGIVIASVKVRSYLPKSALLQV
jgi:hypothetical protein